MMVTLLLAAAVVTQTQYLTFGVTSLRTQAMLHAIVGAPIPVGPSKVFPGPDYSCSTLVWGQVTEKKIAGSTQERKTEECNAL
jgi:hypothetical protein